MSSIEEKVESLLKETVNNLGFTLYDVMYQKEGKDYFLRIFIDKPEGIDLDDCEKVSNSINSLLDSADYIKEQYFLEVSSPGIERIIRKDEHLKDNLEKEIELKLFKSINGQKNISGILKSYNKDNIILQQSQENITINRKDISTIKTVYNW